VTGCLKADRSNRLRATHVHGTVSPVLAQGGRWTEIRHAPRERYSEVHGICSRRRREFGKPRVAAMASRKSNGAFAYRLDEIALMDRVLLDPGNKQSTGRC
jgi:hypothetical protein